MLRVMARQMNAPLLIGAAVIYSIAFAATFWLRSRKPAALARINGAEPAWMWALAVLAGVYLAGYAYLSIHAYHKLMCGAWDLGIFDSLFFNALRGRFFEDFRGPFDHFQPIYILFTPVYAIWPDGRMLLILQSALLAAAAWPLYLLAKQVSGTRMVGAAVAIIYLLYPLVGEANLWDFHMLSASPVCFFTMLLFMVRRRWPWYWVFVLLTLSVKESESIIVFGAGLYLLSRRECLQGMLTVAASVAWFFAATFVLLPLVSGAEFRHLGRFGGLDAMVEWAYATDVGRLTASAYAVRVAAVCLFTLIPAGFLFARRWRTFLLLFGPAFAINMVAKSVFQNTLFGHYAITAASAAMGGCALATEGLGDRRDGEKPSAAPLFLVIVAALSNVFLSYPANEKGIYPKAHVQVEKTGNVLSFPLPWTAARREFYGIARHEELFFRVKDCIPDGANIIAQNNLAYPFVNRCAVRVIPLNDPLWAEFYLFDTKVSVWPLPPDTYEEHFRALEGQPDVVKFLDTRRSGDGGFVFYARGEGWHAAYQEAVRFARLRGEEVGFPEGGM